MIKYRLVCEDGHEFEGWFQSGDAFDLQAARGQIACPCCGQVTVNRAIMAPSIASRSVSRDAFEALSGRSGAARQMYQMVRKLREEVEASAEYVGPRFAEEARKIHFQESPERGIYGEASLEDAKALSEDGIPILAVPRLPEDLN